MKAEAEVEDRTAVPLGNGDLRVGRRLRALRVERGLSLAALSAKAGLSIGALSQIERGVSSLRVRVLWPLAAALQVEPQALLGSEDGAGDNDLYCIRADKRRDLPVRSEGIRKELLSPPGAALTGMMVSIDPGGGTEAYAHTGHEFGVVITGEAELVVDSAAYVLRPGDSFAFRSSLLHSFRNLGPQPCTIVWVNTQKPQDPTDAA